MKKILTLSFLASSVFLFSQQITHGPIAGGVTHNSVQLFLRSDVTTTAEVQIAADASFSSIVNTVNINTDPTNDNTANFNVNGLVPSQTYFVRVKINGNNSGNTVRFKTFPTPGTASDNVLLFGSCVNDLNTSDSAIFVQAALENPDLFTFTGDWGYPDDNGVVDVYLTTPPTSWANDYNNVLNLYKEKYSGQVHYSFLQNFPVDYVYDDHDYLNDNAGKDGVAGFNINLFSGDFGAPENWQQPPQARINSIKGYNHLFPHYPLIDTTEGIYHSYLIGNTEVFVLDCRSMRIPAHASISKVGNNWVYSPPAIYTMLGNQQLNWLKNGLSNSTATWKIIVSSVTFNISNQFGLDTCLSIGSGSVPFWAPNVGNFAFPATGYSSSAVFADMWSGYKTEAAEILNHVLNNNIKNVFIVSGDSHTVGLDDGTNSGIPELMSANLKKANSQDALLSQQFLGYNIWNIGGSGLCQKNNFNNTYGKIKTFGNDSIRLSAVDAVGAEVVGHTFPVNHPYLYNPNRYINRLPKANNDTYQTMEDVSVIINPTSNDTDPENDTLYVSIVSNPSHGTLTQNGNQLYYTPNLDFYGNDTIIYMICDDAYSYCPNCSQAKIFIQVADSALNLFENQNLNLKCYPNPVKDELIIEWNEKPNATLSIYSLTGTVLFNSSIKTGKNKYNFNNLSSGIYLMELKSIEGNFYTKIKKD